MQQIRFDFLGGLSGGNSRNGSANANAAETGDAFAQILDRQMTRRSDPGNQRRATDPGARSDAADRDEAPRPQVSKRRDSKAAAAATPDTKPQAAAKPAPKPKQPEKPAAESEAKPAATKPQSDETDPATAAASDAQTATEATGSTTTAETQDKPDTSGNPDQPPPDDGSQQPASDGPDQGETAAASADLGLLATLAVPLPLQTITADTGADAAVEAAVAGGGKAAAALQAALAASLAGSLDFGAAAGGKAPTQTSTQAPTGGLTFGAIVNANLADAQKPGADAVATLQDTAEELAGAADPLAALAPDADGKRKDPDSAGSKAQDAAQDKAATVKPELNAKASASIVQPMPRAAAITWSGTTNVRNELAESMALQADAGFTTDDAEFSNWSQVLGSGTGTIGSNAAARQSAFMTQLRQNLQILPAHEQIAVQIKNAMQNGNSRLTVALHPAELGRVEVKLDIDKDKKVTATVVVDRPGTLDLLRNDAKALERALQDAGLQTGDGSLSFNLRDSNGQNGGAAQNGTGTGGGPGSGTGAGGPEVRAEAARSSVVATADGYVDLET
jgi:flagellar hook-length control protein FliK